MGHSNTILALGGWGEQKFNVQMARGAAQGGFWSLKLIDALIPDVGLSTTLLYAADCKYVLCMTLLAALLN